MIVIVAVVKFLFALLLLLRGIRVISISLRQVTGGILHTLFKSYTSTPLKGFLLGAVSTAFYKAAA